MAQNENEIVIDAKKLEALLPGKRIVDEKDLGQFWSLLYGLRDEAFKRKLPKDFHDIIFHLEQYFQHYVVNDPGPHRRSKEEALRRLHELLPK